MKARELRELAKDELEQKLRDLRRQHFELRKVKVAGKLENPLQLRSLRRDIARVITVLGKQQKVKSPAGAQAARPENIKQP